jgi:uronate dehydrogenase
MTPAASDNSEMLDYNRILVTGAAGYLGKLVRASLRGRVPHVRLTDIAAMDPASDGEELFPCDLADAAGIGRAFEGVDAVVHLGASLNVDDWQQTLNINIAGTYNVFEAARRAGARRVVYASSHHAVGMYPVTERIGLDVPLRPDSLYGLSKCFGENLARYCWDKFGLEAVCLRIGSTRPAPAERREYATWLSEADFERLLLASLSAPSVGCSVAYGVSDNSEVWWDNAQAAHLGFRPLDKAQTPAGGIPAAPDYPLQGGKRAAHGLLAEDARLCVKR